MVTHRKGPASQPYFLECISCQRQFKPSHIYSCPDCGDLLQIKYNYKGLRHKFESALKKSNQISVWRYKPLLPTSTTQLVSIGEGGTALSRSNRLAQELRMREVYFKNDGQNPTGSFKDRGMTVAITRALEIGSKSVLCASTGNTSASMAAYAAKAGLSAVVLVPKGKIARGKLVQAIVHGARIVEVRGNFDQALRRAREMTAEKSEPYLVNSVNPYRVEGQKTAAFEIWEQLDRMIPDFVFVPVGNAGNISAIWKGFRELKELKLTKRLPKMVGVQAAKASPIADAYAKGLDTVVPWEHPETVASAIRIGAPASWKKALKAVRESNGAMLKVSDNEIRHAQRLLADHEGIFAEPASAASVAGLIKVCKSHLVRANDRVVCIITGHGLKDQEAVAG
jgi:threonine synthase